MQSFWFAGLVLLVACGFSKAVPVDIVDQLEVNNDSETRLIVPPEMTPNYFELLKAKSEKDVNATKAEKADSMPVNFLRTSENSAKNVSSNSNGLPPLKPILAFDGSKQAPIFITIPIYITSGSEGIPIIATSIEKITPSQMLNKNLNQEVMKIEEKINEDPSPSPSMEEIKLDQGKD